MTWNHRVIRHLTESGNAYYVIHECLYSRRGAKTPHSWTEDSIRPLGDDLEGLKTCLRRMLEACDKPVLEVKSKGKKEWLVKRRANNSRGSP